MRFDAIRHAFETRNSQKKKKEREREKRERERVRNALEGLEKME